MKKYLFLAAMSAMMFASCSDDITNEGNGTISSSNQLKLNALSNQAGRASVTGAETRGVKADRLKLVARIAPVSTAAEHNWSATGISFSGGNAYVSWHSNHQAQTPADQWGGALDQLSIAAIQEGRAADIINSTLYAPTAKFNNVVVNGGNLYIPMTCYNNGAVVGRLAIGAEAMDTIGIPGAAANAVALQGSDIYAVTGYAGGVYKMPANFTPETEFEAVVAYSDNFGGKYIAGDYVLGTNDTESYLISLNNPAAPRTLGAPLTSAEKYAETYDPANGTWAALTGEKARHYGKHTMALDGGYIYVGGGLGSNNENGLRVYAENGGNEPVWQNGTNTTAVTADSKYVYAATGAGLRVYEKFNGEDLKLFAYEVKEYDENGNAIGYQADTAAQSNNFVAVEPQTGLIFVAAGQSGVFVFSLDENAAPKEFAPVTLSIPAINSNQTQEVEVGESATFTIPTTVPTEEDKDFLGWAETEGATAATHKPGDTIEISKDTTLYPVWKAHEYALIINFVGNRPAGENVTGIPATIKSDVASVKLPSMTPATDKEREEFIGWSLDKDAQFTWIEAGVWTPIKPGDTFTATNGEKEVTLYAIWVTNAFAGGEQGGGQEPEKPTEPEGSGSDIGGGRL